MKLDIPDRTDHKAGQAVDRGAYCNVTITGQEGKPLKGIDLQPTLQLEHFDVDFHFFISRELRPGQLCALLSSCGPHVIRRMH